MGLFGAGSSIIVQDGNKLFPAALLTLETLHSLLCQGWIHT